MASHYYVKIGGDDGADGVFLNTATPASLAGQTFSAHPLAGKQCFHYCDALNTLIRVLPSERSDHMQIITQATKIRQTLKAVLSSDHFTPATGKTIAATLSKNGGAFSNPNAGATNLTEIGGGWYYLDLDAIDTNTIGPLIVGGTCANVDDLGMSFDVHEGVARW